MKNSAVFNFVHGFFFMCCVDVYVPDKLLNESEPQEIAHAHYLYSCVECRNQIYVALPNPVSSKSILYKIYHRIIWVAEMVVVKEQTDAAE